MESRDTHVINISVDGTTPQFHFGLQPDKIVEYKQTHGWSDTIDNVVIAHRVNSFWQRFWYQMTDMFYSGSSGPIGIHHNKYNYWCDVSFESNAMVLMPLSYVWQFTGHDIVINMADIVSCKWRIKHGYYVVNMWTNQGHFILRSNPQLQEIPFSRNNLRQFVTLIQPFLKS